MLARTNISFWSQFNYCGGYIAFRLFWRNSETATIESAVYVFWNFHARCARNGNKFDNVFSRKKKHKITLPPHDFKVYNLKSWVTINDDKFLIWGLLWKLNRMMFWKNSFFEKKCDLTVKSDLPNVMFWRNWLSSGFWKRREKQFALSCVLEKQSC